MTGNQDLKGHIQRLNNAASTLISLHMCNKKQQAKTHFSQNV